MNAVGIRSRSGSIGSKRWRLWSTLALFTSLMLASAAPAEPVPVCEKTRPGHVVVYGDVEEERVFSSADLLALPRTTVQARFHDGPLLTFEGVTLRELLVRSGVAADLRGGDLTRYVVVEAADGYRALFSLAELDPGFRTQVPILADRENGHAIEPRFGPFQVIQPAESQHARSVRQVVCLRLGRDVEGDRPTG